MISNGATRSRRRLLTVPAALAAAVLLASCGNTSGARASSEIADSTPAEETAAGRSPTPTSSADSDETVTFQLTGSGKTISVTLDPEEPGVTNSRYDVVAPRTFTVPRPDDADLLQIVVVGDGENATGCRIVLDGRTVDEKAPDPAGGHCIYPR